MSGVRCPECGHTPAQFDREDSTCGGPHPTSYSEQCGHACASWTKTSRPPVDRQTVAVTGNSRPTSVSAALRSLPRAGTLRRQVYDAVKRRRADGMTDDEIEIEMLKSHQSVSATRNGLMEDGWLVDSGARRPTRYGNDAIVWVAVLEDGIRLDGKPNLRVIDGEGGSDAGEGAARLGNG